MLPFRTAANSCSRWLRQPVTGRPDAGTLALAAGILLLALAVYKVAFGDVHGFVTAMDHGDALFVDFTRHYHPQGQAILGSKEPVFGYFYSAFFALLLAPLGALERDPAVLLWGALQIVALVLLLALPCRRLLAGSRAVFLLYLAAFAGSYPVLHNLSWGQVSTVLVLLVLAALFLLEHRCPKSSAVLLALSASIKFYTVPFLLYPLLRRQTRYLLVFGLSTLLFFVVVPAVALGWEQSYEFAAGVTEQLIRRGERIGRSPNSQYMLHVIERLGQTRTTGIARMTLIAGGHLIFAANACLLFALLRKGRARDEAAVAFALCFLSLPFVIKSSWPHYFVYLPFVQGMLASWLWRSPRKRAARVAETLLLLLPSIVLSSTFTLLTTGYEEYNRRGTLFFANLLLLMLTWLHVVGEIWPRPGDVSGPGRRQHESS